MSIWAVTMVRNEEDMIERTITHLIEQGIDGILVADNLSSDGTRQILERLPVEVVDDPDPAYRQSEKMTSLAELAAARGADWIIPFDADELWCARTGTLRDAIETAEANVLAAPMYNYFPTPLIRFRRSRHHPYPKVAFRWADGAVISDGNHGVSGIPGEVADWGRIYVRHYPWRSWPQYRRKMRQGAAALAAGNIDPAISAHWRRAGAMPTWRLRLRWWRIRLEPRTRRRPEID